MNISKDEQRVLHALAKGGRIVVRKRRGAKVAAVDCYTREGWRLDLCDLEVFRTLRRKRLIGSRDGTPYQISERGLRTVVSRCDNR